MNAAGSANSLSKLGMAPIWGVPCGERFIDSIQLSEAGACASYRGSVSGPRGTRLAKSAQRDDLAGLAGLGAGRLGDRRRPLEREGLLGGALAFDPRLVDARRPGHTAA
jgi:hypothetical protein